MDRLQQIFETYFRLPDVQLDERRKRFFVSLCIFVAVPLSAIYGLIDIWQGRVFEGVFLLTMDALLIAVLVLFRYFIALSMMFRICAGIGLLVLVYELAIGGGDGYAFLWFYFYPITYFYIFGRSEGGYWTLASAACLALLLFSGISQHDYNLDLSIRILLTYSIVAILSYALEASRDHYYRALHCEKQLSEKALREVKTLSGLLPVCSHCKKVRDDKGYWNQIEAYVMAHSNAGFSHGICPECAEKHYPGMNLYGQSAPGIDE